MNKQTLLGLFLLSSILLSCTAYDTNPQKSNKITAQFWDSTDPSQKYENWCDANCKSCSSLTTCDVCNPGYSLYQITSDKYPRCRSCNDMTWTQWNYNQNFQNNDYVAANNVNECCWQEDPTSYSNSQLATSCSTNIGYFMIGSYCMYIPNCSKRTPQYTKCLECIDGYIIDQSGSVCKQCQSFVFPTSLTGTLSQSQTCAKCHGMYQCTVCSDGYYLRTNTDRSMFDPFIGLNPSVCEQCPDSNCKTCNEGGKCQICNDGYYYRTDINLCYKCGVTGNKLISAAQVITASKGFFSKDDWRRAEFKFQIYGCNTCHWDNNFDLLVCDTCQAAYTRYSPSSSFADSTTDTTQKITLSFCTRTVGDNSAEISSLSVSDKTNLAAEYNVKDETDNKTNFNQIYSLLGLWDIPYGRLIEPLNNHASANNNMDPFRYCSLVDITRRDTATDKRTEIVKGGSTTYTTLNRVFYVLSCNKCYSGWISFQTNSDDATSNNLINDVSFQNSQLKNTNLCWQCNDAIKAQAFTDTDMKTNNDNNSVLAYRCKKDASDANIVITQCGPNLSDPTSFNNWQAPNLQVDDNNGIPHTNIYYLVTTNYGQSCVQNQYNCKTIDSTSQTLYGTIVTSPSCSVCYTPDNSNSQVYYARVKTSSTPDIYKCIACSGNCLTCSDNNDLIKTKCDSCPVGGDLSDYTWIRYYQNPATLADSIRPTTYWLDTANNACSVCITGCFKCLDSTSCVTCFYGYYLDSTKTSCQICKSKTGIDYCGQCSTDPKLCTACVLGYTLYESKSTTTPVVTTQKCYACEQNCNKCNPSDRKTCTDCVSGFYLEQGKCKRKRNGCLNFEKLGGKCNSCEYGFRLGADGFCYACIDKDAGYYQCPVKDSTGSTKVNACKAGQFTANVIKTGSTPTTSSTTSSTTTSTSTSSTIPNQRRNLMRNLIQGDEMFEEY